MRFSLVLALIFASPAFATRARLHALNQPSSGSNYITDTRNIFLNPAQIGLLKENAVFEWGRRARPGLMGVAPDGEGGFIANAGRGKIGVELGRVTEFGDLVRAVNARLPDAAARTAGALFGEGKNTVDLVYGAGTDTMHWGAGASLTRSRNPGMASDSQATQQAVELRAGVNAPRYDAFAGLLLGAKSSVPTGTTTGELRSNIGIGAGGGLQLDPAKRVYGHIQYDDLKVSQDEGASDYAGHDFAIMVGFFNSREVVAGSRFFYALELAWDDLELKSNKADISNEKSDILSLPLTMGIEADALSWLRLRASLRQGILLGNTHDTTGTTSNRFENSPNDTSIAAGAGAVVEKFNLDLALVQGLTSDNGRIEGALSYLF